MLRRGVNTVYAKLDPFDEALNDAIFAEAAAIIKIGGLVAFPTETVYGLGANAFDPLAIMKIYEAKGRPSDNPLIIHISNEAGLNSAVSEVTPIAKKLIEAFWPGPLTLILPKKEGIPRELNGNLPAVAVRCPYNTAARRLIDKSGVPIAAPSANISGKPSPTRASHVLYDLDGKIDMVIDGGECEYGIESTIIDVSSESPVILRPGSITARMIEEAAGIKLESPLTFDNTAPKAPGMKYSHYSPLARLTVVSGELDKAVDRINLLCEESPLGGDKIGVLATEETKRRYKKGLVISAGRRGEPETIAKSLFWALRKFDFNGVAEIYSEAFYETELGRSVMNRLEKASGSNIIQA